MDCHHGNSVSPAKRVKTGKETVFTESSHPSTTNITFQNTLTETDTFNYFLYSYMYMGGGVSVVDFNNDGLTDIYFTGMMVSRLESGYG